MVFVKNVKLCEAQCGEHINDFAKELVNFRKQSVCDIIGKFNDVYIEVNIHTTEKYIIDYYNEYMHIK